jgi:hypothetical protein
MKLPNTQNNNNQIANDGTDFWHFGTRTIYSDIPRVVVNPSTSHFLRRSGAAFAPSRPVVTGDSLVAIIQEALDLVADISFDDDRPSLTDQGTRPAGIDEGKSHKNSKGH